MLSLINSETDIRITSLSVDGGASKNNLLMQFQSDLSNVEIVRQQCTETTALGAALLSGLASGVFASLSDIKSILSVEQSFSPSITDEKRASLLDGWHDAVSKCKTTANV